MRATCVYIEHVLSPQKRRVESIVPGMSITDLNPAWDMPYIAVLNGKPVLRKDWDLVIKDGQVLAFVDVRAIPQSSGGGGKNPMRTIAMLAVMVAAPKAAVALVGMTSLAGTAATVATSVLTAGFMIGGTTLVNALLPAPTQQLSNLKQQEMASPSPTYNLQAQGNRARIDAAIPEHFGRHIVWPDLAAIPYQEYQGNEQYLYQLMCIGRGEYDIEQIKIEDTPIGNFEEIEYEVIPPHGELTLFPGNVITATEVSGQDMPYNEYIGPFVASATGTEANFIGVDFVAPRGLYEVQPNGNLRSVSIQVRTEIREIDDEGDPLGNWTIAGEHTFSAATATPRRYSRQYTVTPGRYEVRVRRDSAKETGTTFAHDMNWASLRAYLQDTDDYGDCTLIAFKMKASSQLSQQASRRVNLIATRKLPTWTDSDWTAPQATRSLAWALAYICKQVGWQDNRIDLDTLAGLDVSLSARGDYFDARFDNFITAWEALQRAAQAARTKPFIQAGFVRFHRVQPQSTPVAMFGPRNIRKGSFSIEYLMPTQDTADMVDVNYFDKDVWAYRTVTSKLPASEALKPSKMELFGVIERAQAFREGMYQVAANKYQRKIVRLETEMEGFIPSYGDLIGISHDLPAWGQNGDVVGWDSEGLKMTVSEPLEWKEGETHYVAFRKTDGSMAGPYKVAGTGDYVEPGYVESGYTFSTDGITEAFLGEVPDYEPRTDLTDGERTQYYFGWGQTLYQEAVVLGAMPLGGDGNMVRIEAVNEDENVHIAETGETVPSINASQLPAFTVSPIVRGIQLRSKPGDPGIIMASWEPSPWSDWYLIEESTDGETWSRVGETGANSWTGPATYGNATILRLAPIGSVTGGRGAWTLAYYSDSSDLMWHPDDETLMWDLDDETLMWT